MSPPSVLVLVENESVPADVRVWAECRTLRRAGFDIVVVCPQGRGWDHAPFERCEGIEIHRFRPRHAHGALGYAAEYGTAFWQMSRLVRRVSRGRSFAVVHAHNPPDILLLAAWPLKRRGARFIFDHHDLAPELCRTRFGDAARVLVPIARALERIAFALADVVIAANGSYCAIAQGRGGKCAEDVFVVRNGPDLLRFQRVPPEPALRRGKPHLLAYVGNMAPQDGIDHAIRALALLGRRRRDWHAVFMGGGEVLPDLQRLAQELDLADAVEFTGFTERDRVARYLCTSDICLAPDPRTPYNDASTMIKIPEYMAMERPIVSYDLRESRFSAGEGAVYARPNDEQSFADAIDQLLDDPKRRARMGHIGRERVERALSWQHSETALLAAYDRILGLEVSRRPRPLAARAGAASGPG